MTTTGQSVPAARIDQLITTEAGDEVLVYDQDAHHIHHLNLASVAVWRLCDGRRTVSDLASATGLSEDLVVLALGKLANAKLLDGELPAAMRGERNSSRRRFLKKAAIAGAVAVPAVVLITAPQSAPAASCDGFICTEEEAELGVSCGIGPLCDFLRCQFGPASGLPVCLPG